MQEAWTLIQQPEPRVWRQGWWLDWPKRENTLPGSEAAETATVWSSLYLSFCKTWLLCSNHWLLFWCNWFLISSIWLQVQRYQFSSCDPIIIMIYEKASPIYFFSFLVTERRPIGVSLSPTYSHGFHQLARDHWWVLQWDQMASLAFILNCGLLSYLLTYLLAYLLTWLLAWLLAYLLICVLTY